jgi:ABC-type dipeptide/oligopeptide/nickel transport system ATPase subunit
MFSVTKNMLIFLMLIFAASTQAKPFAVSTEVSISNGDWYPLPESDMKAAAVDTALAELTKGGLFSIVEKSGSGKMRLEISLIGPAETAKLTIHVNLKDQPSYVSTASISVHDMDFQGIYNAFEHIGLVAAQRLNDKTEALLVKPNKNLGSISASNDRELQAVYDEAQRLKRNYQYKKSRILFEQVAAENGEGSERLRLLAEDELRYGLTVFEARQWMVAMGSSGNPAEIADAINKSENLYRQVLAENSDSLTRTQDAQAALDNLSVSRNALKNVLRAQTMIAAGSVRMMLQQQYMMTGECPSKKDVSRYASGMHTEVTIRSVKKSTKETRYSFIEDKSGNPFVLSCATQGISVVN